jgi:hypothetical protein
MESLVQFASRIPHAIEAPHIQDLGVGNVTSDCVATHVIVQNRPSVCEELCVIGMWGALCDRYVGSSV